MADLKSITRPALAAIKPYVPGKPIEEVQREYGLDDVIKLASNENPLGPSPKAVEALQAAISNISLYPDGAAFNLRQRLASFHELDPEYFIIGNGSDEVLKLLAETFINPGDEAIIADPTFSEYEFCCTLMGGKTVKVPVDQSFGHDLNAMLAAITDRTKLIFLCNPNNPTGTIVSGEEIDAFLAKVPEGIIVVFDEAYYEYVTDDNYETGLKYVKQGHKNVIALRTFSKIYGLSGLRIGYGMAQPELIQWVSRAREPFNVNSMAQEGAIVALDDSGFVDQSRELNNKGKEYLYQEFTKRDIAYIPSQANFIFADVGVDCQKLFKSMLQKGVIVRTGDIFGYPSYIRVTVGTEEQNQRFIAVLDETIKELR